MQHSHMSPAEPWLKFAQTRLFLLIWEKSKKAETELDLRESVLLRARQPRKSYFLRKMPSEFVASIEDHYLQIYFQSIDIYVNSIKMRFQQKDYLNCNAKV